jgi:hypothetical protein
VPKRNAPPRHFIESQLSPTVQAFGFEGGWSVERRPGSKRPHALEELAAGLPPWPCARRGCARMIRWRPSKTASRLPKYCSPCCQARAVDDRRSAKRQAERRKRWDNISANVTPWLCAARGCARMIRWEPVKSRGKRKKFCSTRCRRRERGGLYRARHREQLRRFWRIRAKSPRRREWFRAYEKRRWAQRTAVELDRIHARAKSWRGKQTPEQRERRRANERAWREKRRELKGLGKDGA